MAPERRASRGEDLADLLGRPVLEIAPRLLGATLTHGPVAVRITEVEAYDGANDPGSHAYRGETRRNAVMFGPPGHLYVYFTYGMHHCCNVVCGPEGSASAVLLRAGEVVDGHDVARERRPGATDPDLARGPARLCRALDIDLTDNGAALAPGAGGAFSLQLPRTTPAELGTGPRVGLRHAAERPWRFWIAGESSVSTYRPAAPLRSRSRPS